MTPFAIFALAAALSVTAVELDGAGKETAADIETLISIGSAAASPSAPADPKDPTSLVAADSTSTLGEAQPVKNEVPAVAGSGSLNKNFGGEDAERSRQRTDMKFAAPNEAAEKWMK
jgi:hypothetical protein